MKIAFSNDHAATAARQDLIKTLRDLGHEVIDYGESKGESVDYPDMAGPALRDLASGKVDRVVLMCGSGIGMSMVANKVAGVRCAMVTDEWAAEMSRRHNDANCLALRAREQSPETNRRIVETWLSTEFDGGRHQPRIDKIQSVTDTINKRGQDE